MIEKNTNRGIFETILRHRIAFIIVVGAAIKVASFIAGRKSEPLVDITVKVVRNKFESGTDAVKTPPFMTE